MTRDVRMPRLGGATHWLNDVDLVRQAAAEHGIDYPIAVDGKIRERSVEIIFPGPGPGPGAEAYAFTFG